MSPQSCSMAVEDACLGTILFLFKVSLGFVEGLNNEIGYLYHRPACRIRGSDTEVGPPALSLPIPSQNPQWSSVRGFFLAFSDLYSFTFRPARNHERTLFHLSPDALKSKSKSGRRFFRCSKKRRLPEGLAASGWSFVQRSHS